MADEKDNSALNSSMQRVFSKISGENPNISPTRLSPLGIFAKKLAPQGSAAVTSPLTGNIGYNPEMMKNMSDPERENTVAHEMTHVRQRQDAPVRNFISKFLPQEPYNQRPEEMEAFQTERDRSLRNHYSLPDPQTGAMDIQLPAWRENVPSRTNRRY